MREEKRFDFLEQFPVFATTLVEEIGAPRRVEPQQKPATLLLAANVQASRVRTARDFTVEPRASRRPVTGNGCGRNAQDFSRFIEREACEKTKFDNAALPFVEPGKLLQSIIQKQQVHIRRLRHAEHSSSVSLQSPPPRFSA